MAEYTPLREECDFTTTMFWAAIRCMWGDTLYRDAKLSGDPVVHVAYPGVPSAAEVVNELKQECPMLRGRLTYVADRSLNSDEWFVSLWPHSYGSTGA